jgi:hypothetical protein
VTDISQKALMTNAAVLAGLLNHLQADGLRVAPDLDHDGVWRSRWLITAVDDLSIYALVRHSYGCWLVDHVSGPEPAQPQSLADRLRALATEVEALAEQACPATTRSPFGDQPLITCTQRKGHAAPHQGEPGADSHIRYWLDPTGTTGAQ